MAYVPPHRRVRLSSIEAGDDSTSGNSGAYLFSSASCCLRPTDGQCIVDAAHSRPASQLLVESSIDMRLTSASQSSRSSVCSGASPSSDGRRGSDSSLQLYLHDTFGVELVSRRVSFEPAAPMLCLVPRLPPIDVVGDFREPDGPDPNYQIIGSMRSSRLARFASYNFLRKLLHLWRRYTTVSGRHLPSEGASNEALLLNNPFAPLATDGRHRRTWRCNGQQQSTQAFLPLGRYCLRYITQVQAPTSSESTRSDNRTALETRR